MKETAPQPSPRLPDRIRFFGRILGASFRTWFERGAPSQAAAVAFFALFSIAPVLLVVIAVAGIAFGRAEVRTQIVGEFEALMGPDAAAAIETMLEEALSKPDDPWAFAAGFVAFLFGATAVFAQLQSSLNRLWGVERRRGSLIRTLVVRRLVSFGLVLAIGFLLAASLAVSAGVAALQGFLQTRWGIAATMLDAVNLVLSVAVFTVLFAVAYRLLPDAEIPWRGVWVGAFGTALVLVAGKWAIGSYLGHAALASTYGAAASIVVILFWIYYASLLVLLGAAFTRVWSQRVLRRRLEPSAGAHRVRVVKREIPTR